jgi:hypothetical protein
MSAIGVAKARAGVIDMKARRANRLMLSANGVIATSGSFDQESAGGAKEKKKMSIQVE